MDIIAEYGRDICDEVPDSSVNNQFCGIIQTNEDKQAVAKLVVDDKIPTKIVALRYDLPIPTVKSYVRSYRKGVKMHIMSGRPRTLDNESIKSIVKSLESVDLPAGNVGYC